MALAVASSSPFTVKETISPLGDGNVVREQFCSALIRGFVKETISPLGDGNEISSRYSSISVSWLKKQYPH